MPKFNRVVWWWIAVVVVGGTISAGGFFAHPPPTATAQQQQQPAPAPAPAPTGLENAWPLDGVAPVQWRDERVPVPIGPAKVALIVGFDEFATPEWSIAGTTATADALATGWSQSAQFHPIVRLTGAAAHPTSIRLTLMQLREHFRHPGGTLVVHVGGRAVIASDGELAFIGPTTTFAHGKYQQPIPLRQIGNWLAAMAEGLGNHAPQVAVVLEPFADPLGLPLPDVEFDDAPISNACLVWLAGPKAVAPENETAGVNALSQAWIAALAAQAARPTAHVGSVAETAFADIQRQFPALRPTMRGLRGSAVPIGRPEINVRLQAVDARTGATLDAAAIRVGNEAGTGAVILRRQRPQGQGHPIEIEASAPGYLPIAATTTLAAEHDGRQADVRLMPAFAAIEGRVVMSDGRPAAGMIVRWEAAESAAVESVESAFLSGYHRRMAQTAADGRFRLVIPAPVASIGWRLLVDDGQREVGRSELPATETLDTAVVRGAKVPRRTAPPIAVADGIAPFEASALQFGAFGRFAFDEALVAQSRMPLSDAPIALAGYRSAIGDAKDDGTRTAVKWRYRQLGLEFMEYCLVRADDRLVAVGAEVAARLAEIFADDPEVLRRKEHFEFAFLPPALRQQLAQAVRLTDERKFAEAEPILVALLADPRLPLAYRQRAEQLLSTARAEQLQVALAEARRAYARDDFATALTALARADRLAPDLPLVQALRQQIIGALAETNTTRQRALPVSVTPPLGVVEGAADGGAESVAEFRGAFRAWAHWFVLDLPTPAAATIVAVSEKVGSALRIWPATSADQPRAVVLSRPTPTPTRIQLPAGRYWLEMVQDSQMGPPMGHVQAKSGPEFLVRVALTVAAEIRPPDVSVPSGPFTGHHSRESAQLLPPGRYPGQRVARNADHWYRIVVPTAGPMRVALTFRHSDGDIDMRLTSASGQQMGASTSTNDNETIERSVPAGEYFLQVYCASPGNPEYMLELTVDGVAPGPIQPQPPPPVVGATPVTFDAPMRSRVDSRQAQWYRIVVDRPATVQIRCEFRHHAGDIDMALFDISRERELATSAGVTNIEEITAPLPAGTFYLKIFNTTLGEPNDFVLTVRREIVVVRDGTSLATAAMMSAGSELTVNVSADRAHWLRVEVAQFSRLTITARSAVGDIGVRLVGLQETQPLGEADEHRGPSTETLSVTVVRGTYHIQVFSPSAEPVEATVSLVERRYDENFTPATAAPLDPGILPGLPVRAGADRWFRIDVPAAGRVMVLADFLHGLGDLNLTLRRDARDDAPPLAVAATILDGEWLVADLDVAGPVFLCVHNATPNSTNEVTLRVAVGNTPHSPAMAVFATEQPAAPGSPAFDQTTDALPAGESRWVVVGVRDRLHLRATLQFQHAEGNLALLLHRVGSTMAVSDEARDTETIFRDLDSGVYLLEVRRRADEAAAAAEGTAFRLQIEFEAPRSPGARLTNTSRATATVLDPRRTLNGRHDGRMTVWYKFELPLRRRVRIDLASARDQGELQIRLFRDVEELAAGEPINGDAAIVRMLDPGTYFLAVSPVTGTETNFALMLLTGMDGGTAPTDAEPLGPGRFDNRQIGGGQGHAFAFFVARPSRIELDCRFSHAQGDIDMTLMQLSGREIESASSSTDDERINTTVRPGVYVLRLRNSGRGQNTYSLELKITATGPLPDGRTTGDTWANTDQSTAMSVEFDRDYQGKAGEGVATWYTFELAEDAMIELTLNFRHADGDIDVELRNATGAVAQSNGESDSERIRQICGPGRYFIHVYNYTNGPPNTFRLRLKKEVIGPGFSRERAVEIPAGAEGEIEGFAVRGMQRWHRLDVTDAGIAELMVTFNPQQGDIDIALFEADNDRRPIAVSNGGGASETIQMNLRPGRYFLVVVTDGRGGDQQQPFTLRYRIQTFSNNTTRDRAAPIRPGSLLDQTVKAGETRWFALDVPAASRAMRLIRTAVPAGRFFLTITNDTAAELGYSLDLFVTAMDDRSGQGAATLVRPGAAITDAVSGTDMRWYMIVVGEPTEITWRVEFDHRNGDIDIWLHRGSEQIADSTGTDNVETIRMRLDPGIYFLRVANLDRTRNEFRLRVIGPPDSDKEFK